MRVGGYQNRQELQIEFYDWIECSTETDLSNKYSFLFHFLRVPGFAGLWRKTLGIPGCAGQVTSPTAVRQVIKFGSGILLCCVSSRLGKDAIPAVLPGSVPRCVESAVGGVNSNALKR